VMGTFVNSTLTTWLASGIAAVIVVLNVFLIYSTVTT